MTHGDVFSAITGKFTLKLLICALGKMSVSLIPKSEAHIIRPHGEPVLQKYIRQHSELRRCHNLRREVVLEVPQLTSNLQYSSCCGAVL